VDCQLSRLRRLRLPRVSCDVFQRWHLELPVGRFVEVPNCQQSCLKSLSFHIRMVSPWRYTDRSWSGSHSHRVAVQVPCCHQTDPRSLVLCTSHRDSETREQIVISTFSVFHSRLKTYIFHKSHPVLSLLPPGLPLWIFVRTVSSELLGFRF